MITKNSHEYFHEKKKQKRISFKKKIVQQRLRAIICKKLQLHKTLDFAMKQTHFYQDKILNSFCTCMTKQL